MRLTPVTYGFLIFKTLPYHRPSARLGIGSSNHIYHTHIGICILDRLAKAF